MARVGTADRLSCAKIVCSANTAKRLDSVAPILLTPSAKYFRGRDYCCIQPSAYHEWAVSSMYSVWSLNTLDKLKTVLCI